jgi:AraC-like DNA-binding protein
LDTLSNFFDRFYLKASVFFSDSLCGQSHFEAQPGLGHIHLVESGEVRLIQSGRKTILVDEPSVIFYPKQTTHSFKTKPDQSVNLVCGNIDIGISEGNELFEGLPEVLIVPLKEFPELKTVMVLMFSESSKSEQGKTQSINLLLEYFVILLLRHAIKHGLVKQGALSALGDKLLAPLMMKLHQNQEKPWTIEGMGKEIGMSRTKFANYFRQCLGETPMEYLTNWRLNQAKLMIKNNVSLKLIPEKVGYSNEISFARAFEKKFGLTPFKAKSIIDF